MTLTKAIGAAATVVVAVQVAMMWSGFIALMAAGLLVVAFGEDSSK